MKLTKFGHACVRLEKGSRSLVIDPGAMTSEPGILDGVEAILITHEHFDHFEADRLFAAADRDPNLAIYTCLGVARHLAQLSDRVQVVNNGDTFSAAGFEVSVVGEKHHFSHPDSTPVDNIGFVIDQEVFHPGDALTILDIPTLLAPGQAPWMTVLDLISYLREIRPLRAYAIHDGLLNDWGLKVLESVLSAEAERLDADIRRLEPGESVEILSSKTN